MLLYSLLAECWGGGDDEREDWPRSSSDEPFPRLHSDRPVPGQCAPHPTQLLPCHRDCSLVNDHDGSLANGKVYINLFLYVPSGDISANF